MKYPKLSDEFDRRKKLTVKWMVKCLQDIGLTYRQMGKIFGVSFSLFGKLKLTSKEARERRYKYPRGTGNTKKYRQRNKKILKDKILAYRRIIKKKIIDKKRKNKYTPRLLNRKFKDLSK